MAQSNWEADKMLDVYIYDYLIKRNLHASAKAFMNEGKISTDPVAIDAPGGFLFEWWSVFWDIFISRSNEKHSEVAAAYLETQQMKAREHQRLELQQLQLMQRRAQLQHRDGSHSSLSSPVSTVNSEGMLGQSTASVLAAKMYEEQMKLPHAMDSDPSHLLDASRISLLKSAATGQPGQLVQGNPGSTSVALQQIQGQTQPTTDIKGDIKLGVTQRPLPLDSVSIYGQGVMQSKSGLATAGINQGPNSLPLKGWPLTQGIDHLRPNLCPQMQNQFMQSPNQFQLVMSQQQQQQLLIQAQAQAQGNLASSPNYVEMDPRKLKGLVRNSLNGKEGQPSGADGSTGSPIQSSSPKVRVSAQDQAEYVMKMKMAQIQQSAAQQHDQIQQQHLQQLQNNRKRKQANSSGPANSTGTGNTVGPTGNSPPSTPSTHTPGDAVPMVGTLPHVNSFSKTPGMHGPEGTSGLASSSNQLDDLDRFGDVGSFDENVESFLTQDDGDAREPLVNFKRNPAEHIAESSKGFSFSEYSIRNSNGKVVCCHFSSDGKLLASAGHEKKAVLWKLDSLDTVSTKEEHTMIITDIRFRPNSTQLATSSFDGTVRLWNAADPSYSLHTYTGHNTHVMSLDFHPKRTDLFCSCDGNGEIRYWNINQHTSVRGLKGGTAQIRFQPRNGQFLAAASENVVTLFDVEKDRQFLTLQGHNSEVNSVCWDANGDFLASVSHESVRVWSLKSGEKCIHELTSSGNKFHSCIFHPTHRTLLIIGGYQNLELWNIADNKTMTMKAHDELIAGLAESPVNGMVASASHDKTVKLWK